MENVIYMKLEIERLKKENRVLQQKNERLKKDMDNARILFNERNIVTRKMKQIKEQKLDHFNLFLKFCKESVIALDSDLRFIYSSDSFLKRIGYEVHRDLTGMHLYEVYSQYRGDENAKEFCQLCRECLQTHETIERQIEYNSPIDNSRKHTTIAISPATNEQGELQNLVIVLKDITEFYEMKEKAEIAGKAKTEFLTNMSHEIRTPMNAIVGMVELIMRENISDIVREHVYNIKSASTNLLGIINDILDISKVESGKIELLEDEYEFASIINDITNMAVVRIDEKDIDFLVEVDPTIPYKLFGDEIRLRQIIINLVNNAIKFTTSGYVRLKIDSQRIEYNEVNLKVSVKDTGMGIKSEDMNKLFESFKQVDTRRNRNIEGTGLGLAISKSLVELMGGEIFVESKYGQGSEFSFIVPQKVTNYKGFADINNDKLNQNILVYEEQNTYEKSLKYTFESLNLNVDYCKSEISFTNAIYEKKYDHIFTSYKIIEKYKNEILNRNIDAKLNAMINLGEGYRIVDDVTYIQKPIYSLPIASILNEENISLLYAKDSNENQVSFIAPEAKILIVDDNAVNLKVACGFMSQYQMEMDTAISGFEALEMVTKKKYNLIFMDHMMPEMDGLDTTKAIRSISGEYYKEVPIVALTANAISGAKEMFLSNSMQDFLSKPIDAKKLNNILKRWIPDELKKNPNESLKIDKNKEEKNIKLNLKYIDYEDSLKKNNLDIDSYIDILKIFLRDGNNKFDNLNHYAKEELKRYIIEVHAIKSSSLSIGAYSLSNKAKLLEEAGKSANIKYIQENHPIFMHEYKEILNSIKENIHNIESNEAYNNTEKVEVDKADILSKIDQIKAALDDFEADVAKELLEELKFVKLIEENSSIIDKTLELIDMFEYDKAIECINKFVL